MSVDDPLVDANDAVFRVETDLTCARLDDDAAADVDVTVDVATLSQLYAGTVSIETAVERERLTASADAVAALAPTFEARDVYVSDFF
jgi:predicted acetyltransferase